MALLQNEDFLIWQLRTSYLTHIKDGIGERLINADPSILNDPSFRAAGWSSNAADIKRTYSPPIPTTISSDYFIAPKSAGVQAQGFNDDEDEGGMVTGRGSNDTVGPGPNLRRRRRREQHDADDSSDLSDDSDDDIDNPQRAAQQIKFAKMPVRTRSGSSPIRSSYTKDGLEVTVTSPSRRSLEGRLRSGSLGGVEAVKQRARRDTATSSDMSSENEVDTGMPRRRHLNPSKNAKASNLLTQKHEEDEREYLRSTTNTIDEASGEESVRSSMSSEFGEGGDSESLLDDIGLSSLRPGPLTLGVSNDSPQKPRMLSNPSLPMFPSARPISRMPPISMLGLALKAQQSGPKNPVEQFARLSGKGVPDPLFIRIFAPFSKTPLKPIDMPLLKIVQDNTSGEKPQVTVADAIGLSLYRYGEEEYQPPIDPLKLNVNRWTLRMVEDGEVDFDFPALSRTRPVVDFTSNNNRGARGRSRERPYDEFALVEATEAQYKDNKALTPKFEKLAPSASNTKNDAPVDNETPKPMPTSADIKDAGSPAATPRRPPVVPIDKQSFQPVIQANPRMGAAKKLKIHFTSLEAITQVTTLEVTTDTYLAEVLDSVCKRWKLDKPYHMLKVSGTNTVAPVDRTVEALGSRLDLDLVRRRFVHEGAVGLAGSPGSTSPNAPLILDADGPRKVNKRNGNAPILHPLSQKSDLISATAKFRKYNVVRKNPMSFAPSHQRVLLMDEEYMHILPAETGRALFESSAKTSRVPFSMIVGCKVSRRHPKTFRVIILRDKSDEQKRYDFEAQNASDAADIVEEIRKGMEPYDLKNQSVAD